MDLFRPNRSSPEADAEARFEALYERHYGRVLDYVLRRARRDEADDVVADTFLVAWRQLERVPDEPLAWLLGVARKTLANRHRTTRRHNALISKLGAEGPFELRAAPTTQTGELEAIAQAAARLSELDQELLKLVAWDGLSIKEAALVVGISHVAGRVRLHRARRRLAEVLGDEEDATATNGPFRIREDVNR
jgi:RNA polymerase sigma-70 factor, ECF subfamily